MLFHRDAIDSARRRLEPLLQPPGLLVTEIATALDISRKYAMPLLDHLDAIHFTQRIDERRVRRSEEHKSELQSLMRISYAVFCLKKKKHNSHNNRSAT